MAPQKSLPASKVALVLSYFRQTAVAHSLKDLEKALPAAAGISSMAVKDYLAHLSGECQLSVEKIGSGNWYWSFPSDAQRAKERLIDDARKERDRLKKSVEELTEMKRQEEEGDEDGGDPEKELEREKIQDMVERLEVLKKRREELKKKVETMQGGVVEVGAAKKLAEKVNIFVGKSTLVGDRDNAMIDIDENRQHHGTHELCKGIDAG